MYSTEDAFLEPGSFQVTENIKSSKGRQQMKEEALKQTPGPAETNVRVMRNSTKFQEFIDDPTSNSFL